MNKYIVCGENEGSLDYHKEKITPDGCVHAATMLEKKFGMVANLSEEDRRLMGAVATFLMSRGQSNTGVEFYTARRMADFLPS